MSLHMSVQIATESNPLRLIAVSPLKETLIESGAAKCRHITTNHRPQLQSHDLLFSFYAKRVVGVFFRGRGGGGDIGK